MHKPIGMLHLLLLTTIVSCIFWSLLFSQRGTAQAPDVFMQLVESSNKHYQAVSLEHAVGLQSLANMPSFLMHTSLLSTMQR